MVFVFSLLFLVVKFFVLKATTYLQVICRQETIYARIFLRTGYLYLPAPGLGPGPQFVFTGPGPQFVFTGPGPQFVFNSPGTQICVYLICYLPVQVKILLLIPQLLVLSLPLPSPPPPPLLLLSILVLVEIITRDAFTAAKSTLKGP